MLFRSTTAAEEDAEQRAQAEDAILETLIAQSIAARHPAPPSQAATPANEFDSNDPLAVLAQTLSQTIELAPVQFTQNPTIETTTELSGIFYAVEAATEIIARHEPPPEQAAEEIHLIETAIVENDLSPESETDAPAPLEVAPILNESGELQPGADVYVPPPPFEIHVPVVAARELPAAEIQPDPSTEPAPIIDPAVAATIEAVVASSDSAAEALIVEITPVESPCIATETIDLDALFAETETDALIEQAIAQEEAVAEIGAAAEEFVAEQIASESSVEAPAATGANPAAAAHSSLVEAAHALNTEPPADRRRKRRALISAPIRVRSIHTTTSGPDEITSTVDVSRFGILFHTVLDTYQRGMDVAVVFPYHKTASVHSEQFGRVVRLQDLPDGRHAVAIALGVGVGEHLVDSSGRKLGNDTVQVSTSSAPQVKLSTPSAPQVKRPLVLAVDSDVMVRDTMKLFLQNEGYEVMAVNNASDAREILNMFTPAVIVAEIEGGENGTLPGLDLCAHVKSSPSLRRIPVVLTSSSAYPSDYANAHSLGAVVCMAKPYKQERLGHIVRLLAPLPEHLRPACGPQRMPDPTRGFTRESKVSLRNGHDTKSRSNGKKSNAANLLKKSFKFPTFR